MYLLGATELRITEIDHLKDSHINDQENLISKPREKWWYFMMNVY